MTVKITTLIENRAGEHHGLEHEHGLSFFIEKDGSAVLFDTGQSEKFIKNAEQLKVNLRLLDHVVLSHGHYDHSGGFRSLVELTDSFTLTIGEGFFNEKYGCEDNSCEYLGNNFNEQFLKEKGIAWQYAGEQCSEILPGIHVITSFPRIHEDETVNPRFKVLKEGKLQPDHFNDEVLLAIDTDPGLVVLLGCSHPGMKNMLECAVTLTGRPLYAVLGGTHLVEADEESLAFSLDYLKNAKLNVIGVSHCTGESAIEYLSANEKRYFQNHTGSTLFVD
jgi:7,8-dihydropterin-6-yl-methyl-4-(beta-D-ribofuranosyl)aminobenzene 5'-phosphate synthase